MGRVEGKVAIITGAASGLGAEDARVLARQGAKVVLTDIQDDFGSALAEEIGNTALYLNHDTRSEARWQEVVEQTVDHFGKLDVLINNAGLVHFNHIEDLSTDDFKLEIDVMLTGTFFGCKHALPKMTKGGGGSIINMASVGAIKAMPSIPGYAASKGGVIAMTRSIAAHCKSQGYAIRVNSVAPGNIVTPMTNQALQAVEKRTPGAGAALEKTMGKPADVADLILFLASDESKHITGQNLVIDNLESLE